jgi:5-oxoprolinase (ATP-hydrolysing) subunit C
MTLVVRRALGLVTVQDLGRPGRMHEAVPRGGALVPARLIAANRAAGNPDDAPAIEVLGALTVRAEQAHRVATDTTAARTLAAGDELVVTSEPRRVAYLALRGGVAAPLVLGGRGALLCAGLGGLVRSGQQLATAALPAVAATPPAGEAPDAPIRLVAGPDASQFLPQALEVLLASSYRVSPSSNRVGTRLDGPALPRSAAPEVSRPMVIGAIEVPGDGTPIVLGPEHPTTGGYPIVAVVVRADLGRLFSIRLGGGVRFTRA